MPEQDQGNPHHDLKAPDHVDLSLSQVGGPIEGNVPPNVEVVKPNADYEAKLMQDYRELSKQGMAARVGPQPAQADIPAIMQPAKAATARERETAETIKRGRGRPRSDGTPAQPRGGESHKTRRLRADLAREHAGRENGPSPDPTLAVASEGETGGVQDAKSQAGSSPASPATENPPQPVPMELADLRKTATNPEDKETRAAAVALLRKLESLSSEWAQRIDALRIERRMRDDQIVLMLLARGIESPDYLELPPDHPYFADNFTPAGAPFRCIVCGKVGSMLYPGQRPLCVNGEMECASRFNQLSDEDKQELLSEATA